MCDVAQEEDKLNNGNLIPNSERSPEELREMVRKGGIKSGESRRRKRDMEKRAKMWFKVFADLEKQGISPSEVVSKLMSLLP